MVGLTGVPKIAPRGAYTGLGYGNVQRQGVKYFPGVTTAELFH